MQKVVFGIVGWHRNGRVRRKGVYQRLSREWILQIPYGGKVDATLRQLNYDCLLFLVDGEFYDGRRAHCLALSRAPSTGETRLIFR